MIVTFQRYVNADIEVFEGAPDKYGELSLPEQMRKLFELELEECEFPAYEIVEVREKCKDDPGGHFFEYVLRFPSLEGEDPKVASKRFQEEQYDDNGMTGFFWMGDVDFVELEKRLEAERLERIRLKKLAKAALQVRGLLDELHDQCKTHLSEQAFELSEKYIEGIGDLFQIEGRFGSSAKAA